MTVEQSKLAKKLKAVKRARDRKASGAVPVKRGPCPAVTLTQRVLDFLRKWDRPMPTPEIIRVVGVGLNNPRARVHTTLGMLLKNGLIKRTHKKLRTLKQQRRVALWELN